MEKKTLKHLIIGGSISVLALASAVLSFVNLSDAKGGTSKSKEWMKDVEGTKFISQLSIPGTHDSGALYSIGDVAGKCQDLSIEKQLDNGARFLDIRLELKGGQLKVVHGIVDERDTFPNVIETCRKFLNKHNSETIIMSVKEENLAEKGEFVKAVEKEIDKNKDLWYLTGDIPTLEQVRGKIVLFSRYEGSNYGVSLFQGWSKSGVFDLNVGTSVYHIQDFFSLENVESKWDKAKECLKFTTANILPNVYTINFMSGYLDSGFPPSYSVPVAKYINKQAKDNIPNYSNTGTVLFDFISEDLAQAVYARNF